MCPRLPSGKLQILRPEMHHESICQMEWLSYKGTAISKLIEERQSPVEKLGDLRLPGVLIEQCKPVPFWA